LAIVASSILAINARGKICQNSYVFPKQRQLHQPSSHLPKRASKALPKASSLHQEACWRLARIANPSGFGFPV
jgi:hypothetical protein